ncbi:MAG: Uma2 family endonuclease [Anaerolineae bacterium]
MTEYIPEKTITLEAFLALERVEIVDGEVVEMGAAGFSHARYGVNIVVSLEQCLQQHDLGIAVGDGATFLMNAKLPNLANSFIPDVALIFRDNIPAGWDIDTVHPGAPDFAVEIVSPNDTADYHKRKLRGYLSSGTREVWRVYPQLQAIERCWLDENNAEVIITVRTGRIDTSRFLPEWHITVEDVFRLPEWMKQQLNRE